MRRSPRLCLGRAFPQDHQASCSLAPVPCPLSRECHAVLLRRDLEKHVQSECAFCLAPCSLCGQQLARTELEAHATTSCPAAVVPCPSGCGFVSQRQVLAAHQDSECPFAVVPCTYASAGCTDRLFRQNLDEHLRTNMQRHLMLVFEHTHAQSARVAALEERLAALSQHAPPPQPHAGLLGFQRLAAAVPAIGGVAEATAAVRSRQWVTVAFVYIFLWWLVPHWLRCIGIFTTAAAVWRKRVFPKLSRRDASVFFLNLVVFALEVLIALRLFG